MRIARDAAVLTVAALAAGGVLAACGGASADTASATVKVPAPSSFPLPAVLRPRLAAARAIMRSPGTVWERAARVRELVRMSYPPGQFCSTLATGFWSLGTEVGLPLRIVRGSANGLNQADTHETVEVWLAGERRWAISDPTFDGYWSLGRQGRPLAADVVSAAARSRSLARRLFWHSAHTRRSLRPSRYYVDPVALYRYVEYGLTAGESPDASALALDADAAWTSGTVYVPTHRVAISTVPPDERVSVRTIRRTGIGSAAGRSAPLRPPFARRRVFGVRMPAGATRVQIPPTPLAVAVTSTGTTGRWKLTPLNRVAIPFDDVDAGRVAPVSFEQYGAAVTRDAPGPAATIAVWAAPTFPPAREL